MRTLIRAALAAAAAVGIAVLTASPAAADPSGQDTTWLKAAHQSNLAEIAAGKAAQRSGNAEVRRLGQMWIQMHTELDSSLTSYAKKADVNLPDGPSAQQQQQLAAVKEKSGQAFDTAWIAQQIGGHADALAATQKELKSGSDDPTLKLARTTAPVVQLHLRELRTAAGRYGTPRSVPGGSGGQAADDTLRTAGTATAAAGLLLAVTGAAVLVRRRRVAA